MDSFQRLSFWEHLDELRGTLARSLAAIAVCSVIFYRFVDPFLGWLIRSAGGVERLVFTSPSEAFVTRIFLTFLGGFLLALPYVLYEIWKFVSLGLSVQECRLVRIFGPLSFLFFVGGTVFAHFILIPVSLQFLLSFSTEYMVPMITVSKYISFLGTLVLACGVTFEMPLILGFLARIGIATPEFLRQKRRHAVVLILVLSALITPPDVITQILMAIPLIILYESGILLAHLATRARQDQEIVERHVHHEKV